MSPRLSGSCAPASTSVDDALTHCALQTRPARARWSTELGGELNRPDCEQLCLVAVFVRFRKRLPTTTISTLCVSKLAVLSTLQPVASTFPR